MKNLLIVLFFVFNFSSALPQNQRILIIEMDKKQVEFDRQITKMIVYNKVNLDSAKKMVCNMSLKRLKSALNNYSIIEAKDLPNSSELFDSVQFYQKWNSFYLKEINDSKGLEKIILENDNSKTHDYTGRFLSDKEIIKLKKFTEENKLTHVIFLNKFETKKKFLSTKKKLILNYEIYNSNFTKIYGGKSTAIYDVSTKMYYKVLEYYLRQALDEFYKDVKKYIE